MATRPIEAKLRITADGAQAVGTLKQVEKSTDAVGRAAERSAAQAEKAAARTAAAREKQLEQERKAQERAAAQAAKRSSEEAARQLRQTQNQMRQLSPQITDIVTGLATGQSPFQVLLQQGGQLRDVFGGTGNAVRALGSIFTTTRVVVGAFAGALATVAFQAAQGALESDRLRKNIALTGNAALVSADQLDKAARRIAVAQNVSIGSAREALEAALGTGEFVASTIESAARATTAVVRLSGESAEETVKQFAALTRGVTDGAVKLNRAYNFLTADQVAFIRNLESQGRVQEAVRFTLDQLSGTLEQRTVPALGLLERGWIAVKNAISGALDALKEIGRDDTPERRIESLERRLRELQNLRDGNRNTGIRRPRVNANIAQVEADLETLRRDQLRRAEEAIRLRTNQQKIEEENNKGLQDSLAQIELAGARQRLARRQAALAEEQALVQRAYAGGVATAEGNARDLARIEARRLQAQRQFVKDQIAIAGGAVDRARSPEERNAANTRIQELKTQLVELESQIRQQGTKSLGEAEARALDQARANAQEWANIWQRAQSKVKELTQQVAGAQARIATDPFVRAEAEVQAAIAPLKQELADLERELQLRISLTVDPGQRAALEKQLTDLRKLTGEAIDIRSKDVRFGSLSGSADALQQRLAQQESDVQAQVQAGQLTAAEGERRILELREKQVPVLQKIGKALRENAQSADQKAEVDRRDAEIERLRRLQVEIEATARSSAISSVSGALDDIVTGAKTGKEALLDMVGSFAQAMLNVLNQRLAEALVKQFDLAFAGAGGGGFFSSLAKVFTFHSGGQVGDGRAATRAVNPAIFALAPRFHDGLLPDEFPAILQRGETVRTQKQERALQESMSVGGVQITNNMSITGAQADDESARAAMERLASGQREAFNAWAVTEMRPGGLLEGLRGRR